jgi:hypothetical protein
MAFNGTNRYVVAAGTLTASTNATVAVVMGGPTMGLAIAAGTVSGTVTVQILPRDAAGNLLPPLATLVASAASSVSSSVTLGGYRLFAAVVTTTGTAVATVTAQG